MSKQQRQRLTWLITILTGTSLSLGLMLFALNQNLQLFYSPSQVALGEAPVAQKIRVGGLVETGSIEKESALKIKFRVTDLKAQLAIVYEGMLPDLFKENQGIVAQGFLQSDGSFKALEVLAKHDENYMPPEVAAILPSQIEVRP